MRNVDSIVATATDMSYTEVTKTLAAISDRLAGIPHQLLQERSKQDDLQLEVESKERDLIQLELAASIGIDNAGKLRAEQHLQDEIKKLKGKLTSTKLETDRIRSEKCHLESLQKDLQTKLNELEQQAKRKKELILQEKEKAYREDDVQGKAIKALSDFVVYSALRFGLPPSGINIAGLVNQELQVDNALSRMASETYQGIVARAVEVSYE
jgi:chromosome segregation ATPase